MDTSILIIDSKEVQRLKDNAKWNPVSLEIVRKLVKGEPGIIPGDQEDFTMTAGEYKIVYTYEEQEQGICRHLSVSINGRDLLPSPLGIRMICEEFGFINQFPDGFPEPFIWKEKFKVKDQMAINILEPLDGNFLKFIKEN